MRWGSEVPERREDCEASVESPDFRGREPCLVLKSVEAPRRRARERCNSARNTDEEGCASPSVALSTTRRSGEKLLAARARAAALFAAAPRFFRSSPRAFLPSKLLQKSFG